MAKGGSQARAPAPIPPPRPPHAARRIMPAPWCRLSRPSHRNPSIAPPVSVPAVTGWSASFLFTINRPHARGVGGEYVISKTALHHMGGKHWGQKDRPRIVGNSGRCLGEGPAGRTTTPSQPEGEIGTLLSVRQHRSPRQVCVVGLGAAPDAPEPCRPGSGVLSFFTLRRTHTRHPPRPHRWDRKDENEPFMASSSESAPKTHGKASPQAYAESVKGR